MQQKGKRDGETLSHGICESSRESGIWFGNVNLCWEREIAKSKLDGLEIYSIAGEKFTSTIQMNNLLVSFSAELNHLAAIAF